MSSIQTLKIIYALTFVTGFTGLAYQVIWQRYLTFIIGSESRSTALVVAIFLGGLAAGYYYWGKITERGLSREQALKVYGGVEIGIGVYGITFSLLVKFVELLSPYLAFGLLSDLIIGSVMLLVPSFLMGATVPLLTAALPSKFGEVNSLHAKIYGINTVGAFLGPLICALVLIPHFGLPLSLLFCGLLNVVAGLYFISVKMDGAIQKENYEEEIKEEKIEFFDTKVLLAVVFVGGMVSISIEVLLMRLISLALGSSGLVYPIVLSLFILGLGWGSLSLKEVSVKSLLIEFAKTLFFFAILSYSIQFLPYWFSNIRASLTTLETNYFFYHLIIYLILGCLLVPMLISMGRFLPLSYGLIKKTGINFADVCGKLYFLNTLGTLTGSLILGHIILYWLDINHVFLINFIFLALLATWAAYKYGSIKGAIGFVVMIPFLVLSTQWDRSSHYLGLFIYKNPMEYNFKGFFHVPNLIETSGSQGIDYFKDGPNTTVTVINNPNSKSIIVNGKSDGATTNSDLSTVILLGGLPLLLTEKKEPLNTAVIGFGTGITAGTLGYSTLVNKVDVLEIASNVIEAAPLFDSANYNASKNDRIKIIEADAFRYFSRAKEKYDIIVSEPSNPWVVGVENLYTQEFMKKARASLTDDGLFVQWIHSYSMSQKILLSIMYNLSQTFKHVSFYHISRGDYAFVASNKEFDSLNFDLKGDNALAEALLRIGIDDVRSLGVLNIMTDREIRYFIEREDFEIHSREFPIINIRAAKAFFLATDLPHHSNFISPYEARFLTKDTAIKKEKIFLEALKNTKVCSERFKEIPQEAFNCIEFVNLRTRYEYLEDDYSDLMDKIESYSVLRKEAIIVEKPAFLEKIYSKFKSSSDVRADILVGLINENLKDGNYTNAYRILEDIKGTNEVYDKELNGLKEHIEMIKKQIAIVGLDKFIR